MALPLLSEKVEFTCGQARQIIDEYFQRELFDIADVLLTQVLDWHLTDHRWHLEYKHKSHHIACTECWDYYMAMKQRCCGG